MTGLRVSSARTIAVALLVTSALAQGAEPPWVIPSTQRIPNSDEAAWRVFIALNWPVEVRTRQADPQARLGAADRAVVWERWKNGNEILRPDGADPGPWEAVAADETSATARFEGLSAAALPQLRHIVHGRMVPVTAPLLHPEKLIEVRFNQASFEHIRAQELYCLEGQLRELAKGQVRPFPQGAIQLKASWRPIALRDKSRYHTLRVTLPQGTEALYGLTALNIAVKGTQKGTPGSSSTWLWAAFEHEDNAQRPANGEDRAAWPLPSHDAFACPEAPAGCDHGPRGAGLEGTVWEHYRLRGTMRAYLDAAGTPQILASSELEAGLQESSSCSTCHSRATIGRKAGAGEVTRLPVFGSSQTQAERRGFVGLPDPAWYRPMDASGAPQATYAGLDFVWSLARAAPRAHARTSGGSP